MDNKLKAVRFIPTLVVEYEDSGQRDIITSTFLYDSQKLASDVMAILLSKYSHYRCCKIIRWQVVKKIITL